MIFEFLKTSILPFPYFQTEVIFRPRTRIKETNMTVVGVDNAPAATDAEATRKKPPGRSSVKGFKRSAKRNLRKSYDYQFKQDVLQLYHQTGHQIAPVLEQFFPGLAKQSRESTRKLVLHWAKHEQSIMAKSASNATASHSRHRPLGVGKVLSDTAEQLIVDWICELNREGVPIAASVLQRCALAVAEQNSISPDKFAASWCWRKLFVGRHKLELRRKTQFARRAESRAARADNTPRSTAPAATGAPASPEDELDRDHQAFDAEVVRVMAERKIIKVFSADLMPLHFEYLPKKVTTERGTKISWVRTTIVDPNQASVMLLGDSDGNKYPLFTVLKAKPSKSEAVTQENVRKRHGFGRGAWKTVEAMQSELGVQVFGNVTAAWDASMSLLFLKFHFGQRTNMNEPVLLLVNDVPAVWTLEVREFASVLNVLLIKIPPNCSWLSQPASQTWIRALKDRVRLHWANFIRTQLLASAVSAVLIKLNPPTKRDIAEWLKSAWDSVSTETVVEGFRRARWHETKESISACDADDFTDLTDTISELAARKLLDSDVGEVRAEDEVLLTL